uniref:uncharacterized protein n=1 Tax=Lonchura striata TaxID=40157 RepID=UPI00129319C7|nr:uncharacterized protein LOC116183799 [Lonchura striata domestica]
MELGPPSFWGAQSYKRGTKLQFIPSPPQKKPLSILGCCFIGFCKPDASTSYLSSAKSCSVARSFHRELLRACGETRGVQGGARVTRGSPHQRGQREGRSRQGSPGCCRVPAGGGPCPAGWSRCRAPWSSSGEERDGRDVVAQAMWLVLAHTPFPCPQLLPDPSTPVPTGAGRDLPVRGCPVTPASHFVPAVAAWWQLGGSRCRCRPSHMSLPALGGSRCRCRPSHMSLPALGGSSAAAQGHGTPVHPWALQGRQVHVLLTVHDLWRDGKFKFWLEIRIFDSHWPAGKYFIAHGRWEKLVA